MYLFHYFAVQLFGQLGIILQQRAYGILALTQARIPVTVPRSALLDDVQFGGFIDNFAFFGDTFAV